MIIVKMIQRMPYAKEKITINDAKVQKKGLKIHEQFAIIKLCIKLNSILNIIHTRFIPNIEERKIMLYISIYKTDNMEYSTSLGGNEVK